MTDYSTPPGDLNPRTNKTQPDPALLRPGQVKIYGRKSTANERAQKSLADQRKICEAVAGYHKLPLSEDSWMAEPKGFGGDLWWSGGGENGLEVPDRSRRTRKVLTELLRSIIRGETKCVIVWNLDRLWRDVSLSRELLKILYKYDCLLYDVNGPVGIFTYEGRNSVLQNAIASQALREAASIASPRGVLSNLQAGILAVSPNVLGFRTAGKGTKDVLHLEDEQDLVNRIYRLLDVGKSDETIAKILMAEEIRPYDGTNGKHPCGHNRAPGNEMIWRTDLIHQIGTDCRYVGRQRHQTKQQKDRGEDGTEYPCEVFLRKIEIDGKVIKEPIVPYDLWDRVQSRKRANARIGHRGVNFRALSSLVRCGIDGEALTAQEIKSKNGSKIGFWLMRKTRPGCRCRCRVSTVREATLTNYIYDVLGPLLHAQIKERVDETGHDPHAQKRAKLQSGLDKALKYRNGRLRQMMQDEDIDRDLVRDEANANKSTIARLEREISATIVDKPAVSQETLNMLSDLRNAPEDEVRLAIRQCLCWIAVLPVAPEREPKPEYKPGQTDIRYSYAPSIITKLVMLTALGTYHTAILYRERTGTERGYPPFKLRPATPDEAVGGVADFPQSDCFVDGLTRAWKGRAFDWAPEKFAPGWSPDQCMPMPMAEFEWDGSQDKNA
jgi:DNA invertase Pin-like site-specific DNA recombinase